MNDREYIGNVTKLAKNLMDLKGKTLIYGKLTNLTMSVAYKPELYVSQVLNPKETQEY